MGYEKEIGFLDRFGFCGSWYAGSGLHCSTRFQEDENPDGLIKLLLWIVFQHGHVIILIITIA